MDIAELHESLARGEDSYQQFKANVTNSTALAAEMTAFSNADGGRIFIGVTDEGAISGLTPQDVHRLNGLISNAASDHVRPPVNPMTENVAAPSGLVVVVSIPKGISRPYTDNSGVIWVKSGADKRRVTSREEMQRLFQAAGLAYADEVPVRGMTVADLDVEYFKGFFERTFDEKIEEQDLSLPDLLRNMNLVDEGQPNLACALLFARNPHHALPAFVVKAVSFPGEDIHRDSYSDSQDMSGKLVDVYQQAMGFLQRNLRHVQGRGDVNSLGKMEIPKIALEELLVNALIHRDYFISAPVRLFVFSNRVEMLSPGCLPNNLTVENIKRGNSNMRNPLLASFAAKLLPYRGLGSGIVRALQAYRDIDFENDQDGNLFRVTILRR